MDRLEERLKQKARDLGFDPVGVAPAAPADDFGRPRDWLDRGFAGEMAYLHRHADARRHPSAVLPEVRSVVMVALNYNDAAPAPGAGTGTQGRVARYARGPDYHDVLRERLKR